MSMQEAPVHNYGWRSEELVFLSTMAGRSDDSLSLYETHLQHSPISIISVPTELGSDARGLSKTPEYLFTSGLVQALESLGCKVREESIACPPPPSLPAVVGKAKNLEAIARVSQNTATAVRHAQARGDFVLALGGDHTLSIGSILGASQSSFGVIWIDAHPDCNTPETTISGNVHGMPSAVLMGFGDPLLTSLVPQRAHISPEHMLYLGLKDMDQAEIDFIRREHVAHVTMYDIAVGGLETALAAIDALSKKVDRVWVSMDIDAIDESYAPGVGMPNQGGFTKREILSLARYIGRTTPLVGLDIVEVNPLRDSEAKTAKLTLELIGQFLGADIGWYQNYMQNYKEAADVKVGAGARDRT